MKTLRDIALLTTTKGVERKHSQLVFPVMRLSDFMDIFIALKPITQVSLSISLIMTLASLDSHVKSWDTNHKTSMNTMNNPTFCPCFPCVLMILVSTD